MWDMTASVLLVVSCDVSLASKQSGPVSKYVSSFSLLCVQAKVPDAHKLHYRNDGLKRFAIVDDAQNLKQLCY